MGNVFTRGFSALLVTQFLGAVNDNMFKQFLILQVAAGGIWAGRLKANHEPRRCWAKVKPHKLRRRSAL